MNKDHASLYADKGESYFGGARTDYVQSLPSGKALRVLEIGCGNGATGQAAIASGKCIEYVGVELVHSMAEEAKTKLSKVHCGNIENMELPYSADYFDALIASEVLEHLVDPYSTISRLLTLVKPGGKVMASSPNVAHWRIVAGLMKGSFDYQPSGPMDETHLRWFTASSFTRLFSQNGVRILSIGPVWPELQPKWQKSMPGSTKSLFWQQLSFIGEKSDEL